MRYVNDVFVCSNTVEPGNFVVGKLARLHSKSPARVCKTYQCPLRFPPAQDGQVPSRPLLNTHAVRDRKSTRLNSSHGYISYAVFCLKKKKAHHQRYVAA